MTTRSLPEIGRRFANRDHTTVIHAVKTITRLSEQDDEMKKKHKSTQEFIIRTVINAVCCKKKYSIKITKLRSRVVEKNTLPILSNVLLQLKDKKLSIIATDLDIIFYDEISV